MYSGDQMLPCQCVNFPPSSNEFQKLNFPFIIFRKNENYDQAAMLILIFLMIDVIFTHLAVWQEKEDTGPVLSSF